MFVVARYKNTHRLPSPKEVTGRNSLNWIHLWEVADVSSEGIFWLLFEAKIDFVRLREAINECVLLAISKCDQKDDLERSAKIIKLGKENSDEEIQECLDELSRASDKATVYSKSRMISGDIYCIKSIDNFTYCYPALSAVINSAIVPDNIFVDIFKRNFPLHEFLLSLASKY